ncbi:peptidyl-glycine alpha-amidating monooxygenase B-like isoform X2 [Tubulanus polymorphus]|uniref:peptidyl-glycine alpha-amidating monooxygenase B-like isoform X2 n=1 Tax=Tubulanus polymorphus TaxID=672921 RepID=UPI003DA422C1
MAEHSREKKSVMMMFGSCVCVILIVLSSASRSDAVPAKPNSLTDTSTLKQRLSIRMPGIVPTEETYKCTSKSLMLGESDERYIIGFEPKANMSTAHHVLLFGCSSQPHTGCGNICPYNRAEVLYAWARDAPPLNLKKGVGFRVGGGKNGIRYLVLQVHYARAFTEGEGPDRTGIDVIMTKERQPNIAGIALLLATTAYIPANTEMYPVDVSCQYHDNKEIHPFGYRTHAHSLGKVITGYAYSVSTKNWTEIGKGDPQRAQAFYPVKKDITVKQGDILAARCDYNSMGRNRVTHIGATHNDEMCNFYMMYYTKNTNSASTFWQCDSNNYRGYTAHFPDDVDTTLEDVEKAERKPVVPETQPVKHMKLTSALEFVADWPKLPDDKKLGQVAGVACDSHENVYIFHRGTRVWNAMSFNQNNEFMEKEPVKMNTIIVMDKNGNFVKEFGKNRFYMPHGLHIDNEDNLWLTDVALHQVFKIPKGKEEPTLVLGKAFKPGEGIDHFCKPTDVAVQSDGTFFVSDGYCNSRIMKFDKNGRFMKSWGNSSLQFTADIDYGVKYNDFTSIIQQLTEHPPDGSFLIPHSIVNLEDRGQVCVADRENGRIQCFDYNGRFIRTYSNKEWGGRLFAVTYSKRFGGAIYAVNGPSIYGKKQIVAGYTLDVDLGRLNQTWNSGNKSGGFHNPHDVCVSHDKRSVYVVEIDPNKVWKFQLKEVEVQPSDSEKVALDVQKKGSSAPLQDAEVEKTPLVEETLLDKKNSEAEKLIDDEFNSSLIIGALLVVPIVLIVIITVIVRLRKSGRFRMNKTYTKNNKKKINLGNFFDRHKGFDRVSTEESDHELDHLSDSDIEEYCATTQKANLETKQN